MPTGFRKSDGLHNNLKHGCYATSEYVAWMNMLARCRNAKHPRFKQYGAKGVTVCERWLKFENFIADMGKKPSPDLTLDRINPEGNYEPSNCRWISFDENRRNRRQKNLACESPNLAQGVA